MTLIRQAILGWACACLLGSVAMADSGIGDTDSSLELGAHLGVITGGGTSAGGLHLGGTLLYRLSDIDWFEGGSSMTLGSGSAACFTDRMGTYLCNHGPVAGRTGELTAGVRRFLIPGEYFKPYVRVLMGVRLVSFPGDNVRGLAIPVILGGGVQAQVNELVSVGGSADLEAGVGFFNRDLGMQPQLALSVHFGVLLRLD